MTRAAVLLVGLDAALERRMRAAFESAGGEASSVDGARAALEAIRTRPVSALVAPNEMLSGPGLDLAARALRLRSGLVVVAIGDLGPRERETAACTGCTMSLANSIKETDVASLLLFDIDLDYNEQLCAAAGELAVKAAVSAIGKTTVLAVEGAIPSAATGGDEHFCTIWSRRRYSRSRLKRRSSSVGSCKRYPRRRRTSGSCCR